MDLNNNLNKKLQQSKIWVVTFSSVISTMSVIKRNNTNNFNVKKYTTICHVVNTGSRPIIAVRQRRARSVFEWATAVKNWFNLPFTKTPRIRKES
jgi:hypothetical protein